jgi:hypothetical protein
MSLDEINIEKQELKVHLKELRLVLGMVELALSLFWAWTSWDLLYYHWYGPDLLHVVEIIEWKLIVDGIVGILGVLNASLLLFEKRYTLIVNTIFFTLLVALSFSIIFI